MGCSSSNTAASTVSTRPGEGQDESRTSHDNSALLPLTESAIFIGVSPHLNVLCLDEFQSKYTEDLMYRWRPAEILKVEGDDRSKVLIRYIGWAETFDHWLDLRTDCSKLAPVNLLTKEQCTRGIALTNEQANVAREFFQHGCECTGPIELIFPSDDKIQPLTSESLAMSKLGVLPTPSEDDIIIRMPAKLPDPVIPNSAPSSNTVVAKRRTSATSTPMMVPHRSQTHEPSTSSVGLTPTAPASLVVPPIQQQQQQQSTQEIATSDNPYCVDDMVR